MQIFDVEFMLRRQSFTLIFSHYTTSIPLFGASQHLPWNYFFLTCPGFFPMFTFFRHLSFTITADCFSLVLEKRL